MTPQKTEPINFFITSAKIKQNNSNFVYSNFCLLCPKVSVILDACCAKLSITRLHFSLGISLIFWARQLFEDCSDTHGPSDIPTNKNQGGSSPVNEVSTRRHTSCWSAFPEIALSASQECDLMCVCVGGGRPILLEPLVISISPSATPEWCPEHPQPWHITLLIHRFSISSSNQYGPNMPCLENAIHAMHFTGCNGLCKTSSGDAVPQ